MNMSKYHLWLALLALALPFEGQGATCQRNIDAQVVALDQLFFYNRLGAMNPAGMIYALRRDVVDAAGIPLTQGGSAIPGQVQLRSDKRPRPLVLRMNEGDCLTVHFQNLLAPVPADGEQPATRHASVHVLGMQLANGIADDGSHVGQNASSLVAPGGTADYTFYAQKEGTYLLFSGGAMTGGEGNGGSLSAGLFGAVHVEPRGAEWYRSQITHDELEMALAVGHPGEDPSNPGHLPSGHPIIDYDAVYPAGHPFAGLPILRILDGNEIVHADLDAIITGPGRGDHLPGTYHPNPVIAPNANQGQYPAGPTRTREEPFREFTVIFHDEIIAVQAFDIFQDPEFEFTLHSVRDGFAINYGTGGIGAEILANRMGVGPMKDCVECKYEEFFLTAWAVGDPATVVDVPANANNEAPGFKATAALYPEDPSNVHHSYIGDHVKFRNLHAGPKEHHIFHLHSHQWLFTPDSDNSTYLDSQAIGPGSGYTYEITYNGSGNRNQTVGDAIFHCHFYPHFAQGMWELWRNHDVFEEGTVMETGADGLQRPAPGARALPDAEILAGTPIPAIVPIPGNAMPPMPGIDVCIDDGQIDLGCTSQGGQAPNFAQHGTANPGYPFFIPGIAGHRPPHPPLDTVFDGGLPRHVITGGEADSVETTLDFSKELIKVTAAEVPEEGADVEKEAMAYHAVRTHDTFTPEGTPAKFVTNGLPPVAGAPYADPCIDDVGNPLGGDPVNGVFTPKDRIYKAADVQIDITFNKVGWHFPQMRILALWEDVEPLLLDQKPPEPFFFRANTNDCITYQLTNLIPNVYELDDFQVRTPTDVIGQHIHLVKFDVTSSDGAANGWNYEDGSFSPQEVQERIAAIREENGCDNHPPPGTFCPMAEPHPFFQNVAALPADLALGAQTTVQRWFADDVLNMVGEDRTLRSVFTHDHFGPSTHQHPGLYAALVIEPEGSTWRDPESGAIMGTRMDGGPTSWRADILTPDPEDSYREFMLEMADFQLAYQAGFGGDAANPHPDPAGAVNPPGREAIGLPFLLKRPERCPNGDPPPCPEGISADDPGTFTVNYRHEPLALRILDPQGNFDAFGNPVCEMFLDGTTNCRQAPGRAGDLAYAFQTRTDRAIPALNTALGNTPYPPLTADVDPGDPFTPLMRLYEGDNVKIRTLVGATEEGHIASIHGVKWLQEASWPDSGYRNAQMLGISEHFEFEMPILPVEFQRGRADLLYMTDASVDGLWNGVWGLMRTYRQPQRDLLELPNNRLPQRQIGNPQDFDGACPVDAPLRQYDVTAVLAADALSDGTLVYNPREGAFGGHPGPLHDPTAILYVHTGDLDADGTLKQGVPVEPLVLRARAGECIEVTLRNRLPDTLPDADGFNTLPMIVEGFNANQIRPSHEVGLHPQLVAYDVSRHDGLNVGQTGQTQTVAPGESLTYRWYAGDLRHDDNSLILVATPMEFGAVNLMPADRITHTSKGLIGALIIEPIDADWMVDPDTRLAAAVTYDGGQKRFKEFVVLFQDDINLQDANGAPIENLADAEDPEDSGQKAVNYRTEPMWFRVGFAPDTPLAATRAFDFSDAVSNSQIGGDPAIPVFTAQVGEEVRFRVLHPGGHGRNTVFQVHGHGWQRMPYAGGSTRIGDNPHSNWIGAQEGHGPANHFDVVLENAGGAFGIPGDYLFRNQASFQFDGGQWGLLRVVDGQTSPPPQSPPPPGEQITIKVASYNVRRDLWEVRGASSEPGSGDSITVHFGDRNGPVIGTAAVGSAGTWRLRARGSGLVPGSGDVVTAVSTGGATATAAVDIR